MNLLEHESKTLLASAGIPIPKSLVVTRRVSQAPFLPLVLKSQVPVGGRGKLGGVQIVKTEQEFETIKEQLFNLPIRGFLPQALLAEAFVDIARELYLCIMINRDTASVEVVAHTEGGMEVESNKDFRRWTIETIDDVPEISRVLADYYGLTDQQMRLEELVARLYYCFQANDAQLTEINPLILTKNNEFIAGDCKITLDDAAVFRHPEWQFQTERQNANFVTIDQQGEIATIANGAGLAMATVDAVYDAGFKPANFLDIGGGASTETLVAAFQRLLLYPQLKTVLINIFAGITRADEVARAIVIAKQQFPNLLPLYIRIAGTNNEAAQQILSDAGIPLLPSLKSCLAEIKKDIYG